ncbi:MAG: hypothetical protein NDI61_05245 [Bdellovibrionaceae bacterium]|nr:hypothetical protein [Pseudobdellovibrionaceae bacterium]
MVSGRQSSLSSIAAVLLLSLSTISCTEQKVKNNSSDMPAQVKTLVENRCVKCHSGASASAGFGFVTNVSQMISAGYITPGDPEESLLYQKMSGNPPYGERMPKGGPYLSASELTIMSDWLASVGVTPAVAITSPETNSLIDSVTNSATYTISGTCNLRGATVTIKVNDVAGGTATCSDGIFSATVDTTGALFADGSNTVLASLTPSGGSTTNSTAITLVRDLNALAIALTSPSNTATYRTTAGTTVPPTQTGTSDNSFITDVNTSTTYAFAGTCNSPGATINFKINGTTNSSVVCDGLNFSGTFNATALDDGSYKLTAVYQGTSTSSTVYIYKWVNPTISFTNHIRPLFANLYSDPDDAGGLPANTSACIDCHTLRVGNATHFSNFILGYWAECSGGGRWDGAACTNTPATNNGNRDNFVFRFSYAQNLVASTCTTGCTPSGTEYLFSLSIVNDNPDVANSVRNRIVRGNPDQSFIYKKLTANAALCADGAKARTDVSQATSARMPSNSGLRDYFSDTDLGKIRLWILEGARTDN